MKKFTIFIIIFLSLVFSIVSFLLFTKTMWVPDVDLPGSCSYSYECGVKNMAACIDGSCIRCKRIIDYESIFGKIISVERGNNIDSLYYEKLMLDPNSLDCFVVEQKNGLSSEYENFTDVSEIGLLRQRLIQVNNSNNPNL
jgi:hypothetical protein